MINHTSVVHANSRRSTRFYLIDHKEWFAAPQDIQTYDIFTQCCSNVGPASYNTWWISSGYPVFVNARNTYGRQSGDAALCRCVSLMRREKQVPDPPPDLGGGADRVHELRNELRSDPVRFAWTTIQCEPTLPTLSALGTTIIVLNPFCYSLRGELRIKLVFKHKDFAMFYLELN